MTKLCTPSIKPLMVGLLVAFTLTACVTDPTTGRKKAHLFSTRTNEIGQVTVVTSPALQGALQTVQDLNSSIPSPANPFIHLGLGALSLIFAGVARHKTNKLNKRDTMLDAVIRGVENGTTDGTVKAHINQVANAVGIGDDLMKTVKAVTIGLK